MKRCIFIFILLLIASASCLARNGVPPGTPTEQSDREKTGKPTDHVAPAVPNAPGINMRPQEWNGVVLWPMGVRVMQLLELKGRDLEQMLKGHPELADVKGIVIADYIVPGPPGPPENILQFYTRTLTAPAWRAFYQSGCEPGTAAIAFKGRGGYLSVLARPNGATVTFVQGAIDLSVMPLLERTIREAIASKGADPMDVREQISMALRMRDAGKLPDAVQILQGVVDQYPDAPSAHFYLARFLVEQQKYEEAGRQFRAAIGLSPLNVAYRAEYAQFLMSRGDLENAQHELEQAITMDPWSASLQSLLGRVFEARSMNKEAEACYRKAIQLTGNSPEAYTDLGRTLEKQGRNKEALTAYQDALKLKSDFAPALEGVARLDHQK